MSVSFTSRLAFCEIAKGLSGRRKQVYDVIKAWAPSIKGAGPTIEDIATELSMQHSSISGRVTELKDAGVIQPWGVKTNRSGKIAAKYIAFEYKKETYQPKTEPNGQTAFL